VAEDFLKNYFCCVAIFLQIEGKKSFGSKIPHSTADK